MSVRIADRQVQRGPWSRAWFGERQVSTLRLGPLTISRTSWPTHRDPNSIQPILYVRAGHQWLIKLSWERGGEWVTREEAENVVALKPVRATEEGSGDG